MNIRKIFDDATRQAALDLPISWASYPVYRARLDDWHMHAGVRSWKPGSGTSLGSGNLRLR